MTADNLPLFHFADSYRDPNQFYLTGFLCPDPFACLELGARSRVICVPDMEVGRAEKETRGLQVVPLSTFRGRDQGPNGWVERFIHSRRVARVRVLPTFPVGIARRLEADGIGVEVDGEVLRDRRRAKTRGEIRKIESVQRRTEKAMVLIRDTLAGCPVRSGVLHHEGRPLTAERLRSLAEAFLLENGCESADTIVAPGRGSADPHWRGKGTIRAGAPVVVDIFPRDRTSRYHADMSRTFVVGRASNAVRDMHRTVVEAQDAALDRLEPGVRLADVHRAVCRVFERRGYPVPVKGQRLPRRGFLHGTGHGLGLEVHEAPTVAGTDDVFTPGDVVTVEPGLYDRRAGGVRIEDVVALTPDGEVVNLTRFDRELEIL